MRDDGERAADKKAEGRRASAITRRIGAENKSREINIVTKTNTVLIHLGNTTTTLVSVFSSFANPMIYLFGASSHSLRLVRVCVRESEGEK